LDDEKMLPLSQYRIECNYFSADLADSAAADRTLFLAEVTRRNFKPTARAAGGR
jgi:hypothetical protein